MTVDPMQFGLEITLVGMGIVFLALVLVMTAITLMSRLDERWQSGERHDEIAAFGKTPTIDTTTLILIAAAVAIVAGGRHRIRAVHRLLPGASPASAWSVTGRTVLQGSHVVTPRPPNR